MKKFLLPFTLLVSILGYGQVGVNTNRPNSTLEVASSSTNTSIVDGIIPPKLTGDQLQAKNDVYLASQTGAIVYVTSGITGVPMGKTIDVINEGLYQFNGIKWNKLQTQDNDINLYANDGTLTENRVVNLIDKTLNFSGTKYGAFSIERRNNGGGPSSSYFALRRNRTEILGENSALLSGDYIGTISFSGNTGSGFDDDFLNNSNIMGVAEEDFGSTKKGSKLVFRTVPIGSTSSAERLTIKNDGNVGIGTNSPTQKLDVSGNARFRNIPEYVGGSDYRNIVSNSNGELSYISASNRYNLSDIYQIKMTNKVAVTGNGYKDLGVYKSITIPANTNALITLNYSMPYYFASGSVYYIGATLYKTIGTTKTELDEGSRKNTIPKEYIGGSAFGSAITGTAVDIINNNTNSSITVTYSVEGYTESNSTTVNFGMYADTGNNFNWGKGIMVITSYFKMAN